MAHHTIRITSNPPGSAHPYRIEDPAHETIHVKEKQNVQWKRDPRAVPKITKLTISGKASSDTSLLSTYFETTAVSGQDPETRGRKAKPAPGPGDEVIHYSIEVEHAGPGSPALIDPDMVMDT